MRAALHAAWLEQQDSARVEALLHGVKNGFRRKRGALDDEASADSHPCNYIAFGGLSQSHSACELLLHGTESDIFWN